MSRHLDGCAAFDERLLEHAFSPSPDAELDRHLVACARCRAARERYLATADALGAALAVPPEGRGRKRERRLAPWLVATAALAAAVLIVVLLRTSLGPGYSVETLGLDASLVDQDGRWYLEQGSARFDVDRGPLEVDTPLGVVRCEEGSFTLSVAREGGIPSMNRKHAALAVTITVAAGAVWWIAGGHEVLVDPGSPWVEREASTAAVPPPDLGALEKEAGPPPAVRAPMPAEPEIAPAPASAALADASPEPQFHVFGQVVDAETGAPVAGAFVTLGTRLVATKTYAAMVQTRADGRFSGGSGVFPMRMPIRPSVHTDAAFVGNYLAVSAEGYSPLYEVPWGRHEAGSPLEAKEPIDLGLIRIHRGARIAGRVLDEHGAPVAGAAVLLSEDLPGSAAFSPASSEEVAETAADGSFSLSRRVAPAQGNSVQGLFAVDEKGIGFAPLDVIEAKGEIAGVEIRLSPAARLEVLVQDPDGRPIAGADVRAEPRFAPMLTPRYGMEHSHAMHFGARPDVRRIFIAETDARGRARFDLLPTVDSAGTYDVVVNAKGFEREWKDDVLVLAGRDTNVALELPVYRPRSIAGTVRSEDGSVVVGARIRTHSSGVVVSATTDEQGAYRLEGIDPSMEESWFELAAPGFVEIQKMVDLPEGGDLDTFDFTLARPLRIAGKIVDEDGRPVAGAKPYIHRENEWRLFKGEQGRTGDDGAFHFDDASAGAWTLQVQAPEPVSDWLSAWTLVDVKGGDESVVVVLERARLGGARVVVEVVDAATGEPLDPLAAELWPTGGWPEGARRALPAVARGAGRLVSDPVDPGTWRMWVRVEGRATAFVDFEIEPGQKDVAQRIAVGAAGTLSGRILFDGRIPRRDGFVTAQVGTAVVPAGAEWSGASASVSQAEIPIEADGSFHLERATPGTWLLTLRTGGLLGNATIEVPSGGVGSGELRPIEGGRLVFRANDAAPKGGMRVELYVSEGASEGETYVRGFVVGEGDVFEHDATVWAGDARWRIEFRGPDEPSWKPTAGFALQQKGSLRVAPGSVERIPVPIVLRD